MTMLGAPLGGMMGSILDMTESFTVRPALPPEGKSGRGSRLRLGRVWPYADSVRSKPKIARIVSRRVNPGAFGSICHL
jgi:hypothetical protein